MQPMNPTSKSYNKVWLEMSPKKLTFTTLKWHCARRCSPTSRADWLADDEFAFGCYITTPTPPPAQR